MISYIYYRINLLSSLNGLDAIRGLKILMQSLRTFVLVDTVDKADLELGVVLAAIKKKSNIRPSSVHHLSIGSSMYAFPFLLLPYLRP